MNTSVKSEKQILKELNDLQYRYDDLIYNLPDALLEIDIITPRLNYMNQVAYNLLGYSKKDFKKGIDLSDLFVGKEYERALEIVSSYVSKSQELKTPYKRATHQLIYEFSMKKKDGSIFPAETQTSFVLDNSGVPTVMRTIIRDATERKQAEAQKVRTTSAEARAKVFEKVNKKLEREISDRKRAEEALRESEERYRQLYENTPTMYFTVDTKGKVLFVNKFGASQLGYQVQDLVGRSVLDVFHEEDKKAVRKQLEICIRNLNQVYQWAFRKLHKNGKVLWVREVARATKGNDGKLIIFIVCEDVTKIKKAEEERRKLETKLQHTQKLESLGELAGGIAHKFNNLLTGILGNASLATMNLTKDSHANESVKLIENAALQAAELTNQMLAYAGKGKYLVKKHDLSSLVKNTSRLIETAVSKKIKIEYDLASKLSAFEADDSQMQQVIMSLINNSADAIGNKSGTIKVSTGAMEVDGDFLSQTILEEKLPAGAYVYIEVGDTGCGISEEMQLKIFDPFFSTKFVGRGLGLAAVLGIVRSHHGVIKLDSKPDKGTNIKILFPAASGFTGIKHNLPKKKVTTSSDTILIIDDEEIARSVAKRTLEKFGFKVLTAKDGQEGVNVFRKHVKKIDGVLLDMTMPKMSGEEALGEMRRTDPKVRVILSSGYNQRNAIARFAGKGLAGFIQKPYEPRALVEKLNEILGN